MVTAVESRAAQAPPDNITIDVGWSYGLTVVATIAAVILVGLAKARFAPLSNLVFDLHQRLDRSTSDVGSQVRIVDIDNESLARLAERDRIDLCGTLGA